MSFQIIPIKEYNRDNVIQRVTGLVSSTMESFESIWKTVGIDGEETIRRTNAVLQCISESINNLFNEEKGYYDRLRERIASYKQELTDLCLQLDMEVDKVDENLKLLELEEEFNARLVDLRKEKHVRIKKYKTLSKEETTLCNLLAIPKVAVDCSTIPTKQQMYEVEESIRMLEVEKKVRFEKFRQARCKLTTIMEVTEFLPETSFELEIMCYGDDTVQLSAENMHYLTEMVEKFEEKKKDLEHEIKLQKDKLVALWNRLAVPKEEQQEFLETCCEVKQSSLTTLKNEVHKYEEIKKQNIGVYIMKLKEEIQELWKKCYKSEEEQKEFKWFDCEDYSEELLERFDEEAEKLKSFYNETKDIFDKINARKDLWEMMLVFEKKVNDPNRFNNRGGHLLKEERERKKILKDLPRLEEEILEAIGKYEERHNKMLLVSGVNFVEYIKEQWDQHNREKELEKLQKQQLRLEQGKTPSKRQLCSTPATAPSKIYRSVLSTTRKSSRQASRLACGAITPMVLYKRSGNTKWASPRFTPNKRTAPRVLLEKNEPCTSKMADATTYSQFEVEVAKEDRKACRSSGTHQRSSRRSNGRRKVLGSKITHDGRIKRSLRSSSGKSSIYSIQGSTKMSQSNFSIGPKTPTKLAPARGKLGLPFLI